MRRLTMVLILTLLISAVVAYGVRPIATTTPSDALAVAKQVVKVDKVGSVPLFLDIVRQAPNTPEAGEAWCYLGWLTKDRDKALLCFRQSWSIRSPLQDDAGLAAGHTLVALEKKTEAAVVFEEVGTKFPELAKQANFEAGMCYLGASRGLIQSKALRDKAMKNFDIAAKAGNQEAKLQSWAMRFEHAKSEKDDFPTVVNGIVNFVNDPAVPEELKSRGLFMLTEYRMTPDHYGKDLDLALDYCERALKVAKTRTDEAWALSLKANILAKKGDSEAAIAVCDRLEEFGSEDNMKGNSVHADALYLKGKLLDKTGKHDEAVRVKARLLREHPGTEFAQQALEEGVKK